MENKIGEIITMENGTKLQIIESGYGCNGCCFHKGKFPFPCSCPFDHHCSGVTRTDGKHIIYKQV